MVKLPKRQEVNSLIFQRHSSTANTNNRSTFAKPSGLIDTYPHNCTHWHLLLCYDSRNLWVYWGCVRPRSQRPWTLASCALVSGTSARHLELADFSPDFFTLNRLLKKGRTATNKKTTITTNSTTRRISGRESSHRLCSSCDVKRKTKWNLIVVTANFKSVLHQGN